MKNYYVEAQDAQNKIFNEIDAKTSMEFEVSGYEILSVSKNKDGSYEVVYKKTKKGPLRSSEEFETEKWEPVDVGEDKYDKNIIIVTFKPQKREES